MQPTGLYQNRNNHQARYQDPDQFRHRSRMPYRNGNFGQDGVRGNATYRNNYGWKDSRGRDGQYGGGPTADKQEPQPRLLPGNKAPVNSSPTSTSAVNNAINASVGKKKQRARKSKSSESGSDSQQSGSNSRSSSSSSSRSSSSASGSSSSSSSRS